MVIPNISHLAKKRSAFGEICYFRLNSLQSMGLWVSIREGVAEEALLSWFERRGVCTAAWNPQSAYFDEVLYPAFVADFAE